MKPCACAARAAASTSARVAPGRPQAMLAKAVSSNSTASCADIGDGVAQRGQVTLAHVGAVEPHRARRRVVEARHQGERGGLAAAGGADQRHRLARLRGEGQAVQRPVRRALVAEADGVELDPPVARRAAARRPARPPRGAACRSRRRRRASPASPSCKAAFSEPSERTGRAAISTAATKPVNSPIVPWPDDTRQPTKPSTAATASPPSTSSTGSRLARMRAILNSERAQPGEGRRRPRLLLRLQPVGADQARGGEALRQRRRRLAHALLHAARGAADALAEAEDRHHGDGIEQHRDQRHLPVEPDHRGDEADDGQHVGAAVDRLGQRLADRRRVHGEARRRAAPARRARRWRGRRGSAPGTARPASPRSPAARRTAPSTACPYCASALAATTPTITGGSSHSTAPVAGVEAVEGLLDDDGVERGQARQQHGADHGQRDAAPLRAEMFPGQAADERTGVVGQGWHGGRGVSDARASRPIRGACPGRHSRSATQPPSSHHSLTVTKQLADAQARVRRRAPARRGRAGGSRPWRRGEPAPQVASGRLPVSASASQALVHRGAWACRAS